MNPVVSLIVGIAVGLLTGAGLTWIYLSYVAKQGKRQAWPQRRHPAESSGMQTGRSKKPARRRGGN
jgi:hypothetical protein